jgi:hypothetical protein
MIRRKLTAYAGVAASLAFLVIGLVLYQRAMACKRRGLALQQRIETLGRSAHDRLPVGTKKDEVVRFFEENQIPLMIQENEASGSILTSGCCPFGCGSDAVLIGVKVKLDETGTAISTPDVVAMCTNCL